MSNPTARELLESLDWSKAQIGLTSLITKNKNKLPTNITPKKKKRK